jgi:cell wall-associated NlpC family hydrolase
MTPADPRITLARADLAAASLEGRLAAARYASPDMRVVAAPVAPLHRAPDSASERTDELLLGERFDALAPHGEFAWGQARRDGYVGFVRAADLAPAGPAPTHQVSAVRTYAFAEPSIKSAALGPFSLNALVVVRAEEGKFSRAAGGGFFWTQHLAPIGVFERDAAAVAERFLGAPYLWGGRTSVGLDCSGLVQQSLYACGRSCPRDADQQAALGREIGRAELARGDLVCWRGHIGLMLDEVRLIHANGHHMAVAIEPLAEAIARIESAGAGAPTAFRRL